MNLMDALAWLFNPGKMQQRAQDELDKAAALRWLASGRRKPPDSPMMKGAKITGVERFLS